MHQTLQQDKFKVANFKYDNIFFQISVQKYLILFKAFFDPNFGIFDFREILQLDKFEGADFQHDNIVSFKFQPKKPQIRHFWAQIFILGIFIIL